MRRTKEDAVETRKSITEAALKVFSMKGYSDTKLEDIAESAGVTRGAIYWHFKNKADLYNKLTKEISVRSEEVMARAVSEGGSFLDICRRIMIFQWVLLEEDPEYQALTNLVLFKSGVSEELEESRELQSVNAEKLVNQVAGFMEMGISSGAIRGDLSAHDLAHAFLAMQKGVAVNWLINTNAFSLKEIAPVIADVFIRGIEAR